MPHALELVRKAGHRVFWGPFNANLVAVRGPGGPGDWDGILHYAFQERESGGWLVYAWPCATRPGVPFLMSPMNPEGTLVLEPGQYPRSHTPGLHKGRPALVQVRPVTGRRDNDHDAVLDPGQGLYTGLFRANIHDIVHPNDLAGCIGVQRPHRDELLAVHSRCAQHQGVDITLTVVVG